MTRKQITVVCDLHDRPVPLGLLVMPARPPLTSEEYDAYVERWFDYLGTTVHPEWTADQCRAKALELVRKNEVSQTEITYQSARGRLQKSGKWKDIEIVGIVADAARDGRVFTFQCSKCRRPKRVHDGRLASIIAGLDGDELRFADL